MYLKDGIPTCRPVVKQRDEKVWGEDCQELSKGAWPLWKIHLKDALMWQLACIGPCSSSHQMPQMDLKSKAPSQLPGAAAGQCGKALHVPPTEI